MSYCRRKNLFPRQQHCLDIAATMPLFPFPRGFAADKFGPFFPLRTVQGLVDRGRLVLSQERAGKRRMMVRQP